MLRVRSLWWLSACFAVVVGVVLLMAAGAGAKKKPPPPPPPPSTTSTYVKNYADFVNGSEVGLTPEAVVATADGGWTGLATTDSSPEASWLVKASSVGAPQWQEQIGCPNAAPGDYADEVSMQQTSDGGYVLAGGTIGCGSGSVCPELTGLQCGLVERLSSTGALVWARVFLANADGTGFEGIRQASDGGFIAVGTATDANHNTGALIVKLDANGNLQWQRELGPNGSDQAYFQAVQQTSDGGYIAAGELDTGATSSSGLPLISMLAVKFDAAGNVSWQQGFNDVGSSGVSATEHVHAVVQTTDGGYAIGGDWNDSTFQGTCCQGALLLKLTANGTIQWQQAYSGGVNCSSNSYSNTCNTIGGGIYSLQQIADGGYQLAGDSNSLQFPGLVPWLAKVDSSGAITWQEQDYQSNPSTGLPYSEYFAASTLTAAGPLALGSTENYSNGLNELLGVQTDPNGAVASCSQIHAGSPLTTTNPGLTTLAPGLQTVTNAVSQSSSPVQAQATTASATASQC